MRINKESIGNYEGVLVKKRCRKGDKHMNGSNWNLMIEWEDRERILEPLPLFFANASYEVAEYSLLHKLIDTPAWRRCRRYATRRNRLNPDPCHFQANMHYIEGKVYKAKLKSFNPATKFKYGVEVPHNYLDAKRLDQLNEYTFW